VNKMHSLISILFGVLALVALALGLAWLLGPQGALPVQQISPVQTPTPGPTGMPTPTSMRYVEPTVPSEDWPTLTSLPTRGIPTPRGTPAVKASPTPVPVPTRPPLALTPVPEGTPPDDLSSLYYVADADGGPELRVVGMDTQGRRWGESSVVIHTDEPLRVLHLSPDEKYLAVEGFGMGAALYVVERSSGRVWCPLGERVKCSGGFVDWTRDNQLLFQPATEIGNPLDVIPGSVLIVDIDTGRYSQLDLPTSPDGVYSYAHNVSLSPDNSRVAYAVTYEEKHRRISEIWTMRIDNENKQLVYKVEGVVHALSWSPISEQLIFSYQPGVRPASNDPSEVWVLNSDGTGARFLVDNYGECYPVWSPDGRHIAFVQVDDSALFVSDWRGPGTNVYVADTATGEITRLSAFEERSNTYPTWSPDGKLVAFVSTTLVGEPEVYSPGLVYVEVWVASVDGSQLYALSGNANWSTRLTWLPVASLMQEK
jgi:Tol biopolymer transport system component